MSSSTTGKLIFQIYEVLLWVTFDHIWSECYFFEGARTVSNICTVFKDWRATNDVKLLCKKLKKVSFRAHFSCQTRLFPSECQRNQKKFTWYYNPPLVSRIITKPKQCLTKLGCPNHRNKLYHVLGILILRMCANVCCWLLQKWSNLFKNSKKYLSLRGYNFWQI